MLLNIILSDFQQYRTLLVKVFQIFVSPEKMLKSNIQVFDSRPTICDWCYSYSYKYTKINLTMSLVILSLVELLEGVEEVVVVVMETFCGAVTLEATLGVFVVVFVAFQ